MRQNGGAGGGFFLANSNNVTFGTNGNTVTASVAGTVAGGTANINLSAGTTSNAASAFTFSNSNGVSFGLNAQTITGSVAAQTNQTVGLYGSSQTTGQSSSSTVDARSVSIVGAGGVSVGLSAGSFIISGATGGGGGGSDGVNIMAAGTRTAQTTGTILWSNSNGVSFGLNTTGGSVMTASVDSQTNQTVGLYAVSNTTQGTSGTKDARSVSFAGAGAVSVGVSNGTVVISAAAGAQSAQTVGFYASSQTTGQSSSSTVDARSISVVAAGLLSAGMSAGSLILSAPDTTSYNPLSVGFSTGGNTVGDTGFGTDRVVLAGGANITLSGSTNAGSMTITISGNAGGGGGGVALSADTQSVSTGTVVFSNSNGITFGMSGSSRITASMALSNQVVSAFAVSNTTQSSSGTVNVSALSFQGAGGASVGISNGSIIISGGTAGGGGFMTAGVSTGGNTAGNTGLVLDRFILAGGNNITLSGSTNAGSMTVTISGFNQSNQTVGMYATGNTTQNSSTTFDARTLGTFNGLGAMTVGYSNGSVQLSAPATSSLSATGAVSISTNGSTISIGVPGGTLSRYEWPPSQAMNISSSQHTNSAYSFQQISIMGQPITFTRVDIPILISAASAANTNTAAFGISAMAVIYTRNGSTFNPVVGTSASSTLSWASNSSNFSGVTGGHLLSFALASMLTPDQYWLGVYLSTTSGVSTGANTTALNGTFSVLLGSNYTASAFADLNSNSANSTNRIIQGILTSVPTNTTQTLQLSQLSIVDTAQFRANLPVMFRNY